MASSLGGEETGSSRSSDDRVAIDAGMGLDKEPGLGVHGMLCRRSSLMKMAKKAERVIGVKLYEIVSDSVWK